MPTEKQQLILICPQTLVAEGDDWSPQNRDCDATTIPLDEQSEILVLHLQRLPL